jgi:hypothetical protein
MVSSQKKTSPAPAAGMERVDPNPYSFRTGRPVLLIEGVVLAVLGVWALAAAWWAGAPPGATTVAGVFSLTVPHAGLLLVTGLLAAFSARWRPTLARVVAGGQAVVYLLLFGIGAVAVARGKPGWWGFQLPGVVLDGVLMAIGLALTMWLGARALEGYIWVKRGRNGTEGDDER